MVGGQAADLESESGGGDVDLLESIHRRKTGAMLRVALRLGAIVAGADAERIDALDRYGAKLGLAFQITDDLLDAAGDQDAAGKRVGKDHRRGKLTYPGLLGVEESRRRAAALVNAAIESLAPFGNRAEELSALARYILERDR
jgi:geranylgeranyl diphosphate synthase type II